MIGELWALLLTNAEDSFIQVTVFVGAVLLLFGYIDYKQPVSYTHLDVYKRQFPCRSLM